MVKYTWDDVIFNPNDERLKDAIGKKVYCSNEVLNILEYANENHEGVSLKHIKKVPCYCPFVCDDNAEFTFIILKKEDPKEYVPFESIEEFIKSSLEHNKNHYLSGTGIWIRCKKFFCSNIEPFIATVTELHNKCVYIGIYDKYISFDKLLKECEFLDGTPCGKLKEFKDAY